MNQGEVLSRKNISVEIYEGKRELVGEGYLGEASWHCQDHYDPAVNDESRADNAHAVVDEELVRRFV